MHQFSRRVGRNVVLKNSDCSAVRCSGYDGGLVFSSEPLRTDEFIQVVMSLEFCCDCFCRQCLFSDDNLDATWKVIRTVFCAVLCTEVMYGRMQRHTSHSYRCTGRVCWFVLGRFCVDVFSWLWWSGCQYQYSWLPVKTRLWSDLSFCWVGRWTLLIQSLSHQLYIHSWLLVVRWQERSDL